MSILTLAVARAHLRCDETDSADAELQPYMDAAEDAAQAYLNRTIYADATAMTAAQDSLPTSMAQAQADHDAAYAAADAVTNTTQAQTMRALADVALSDAQAAACRVISGVVINASISAAVLLTLGHLFANREDNVTGLRAAAVELPTGTKALLRPYRRVMTP